MHTIFVLALKSLIGETITQIRWDKNPHEQDGTAKEDTVVETISLKRDWDKPLLTPFMHRMILGNLHVPRTYCTTQR